MTDTPSNAPTAAPIRVAVDAMGGDHAPRAVVQGALDYLRAHPDGAHIILVGDIPALEAEIATDAATAGPVDSARLHFVQTSQLVAMDEHPTEALREKPDSSLVVPILLVKRGEADAAFSAGNTGAFMVAATQILERIEGIRRPAIATVFPTETGRFSVLVDAGANTDIRPSLLLHFAVLGSVFAETALSYPSPRVGIIANGSEEGKGNELTRGAYPLLAGAPHLNFIGNVEGNDLFEGTVDVAVCDGFVGNVLLKGAEGLGKLAMGAFYAEMKTLMESVTDPEVKAQLQAGFARLRARLDYSEIGGAPLLGVNGIVIIAHGRSDRRAIHTGIRQAVQAAESGFVSAVREAVQATKDSGAQA